MKPRLTNEMTEVEWEAEAQRAIAEDPDCPELTDEQLAQARPFAEAFPDLAASIARDKARIGRPPKSNPLQQISIRLEPEVITRFKATGPGWQRRINNILKAAKL